MWWVAAVAALVATTLLMVPVTAVANRHLPDAQNERSSHVGTIPRGGGAALVAATLACAALLGDPTMMETILLGGVLLVALIGLVDDVADVWALPRLLGVLLVAAGVSWSAATSRASGPGVVLVVVLGCFLLTAFTNAFNFMDGIDLISAMSTVTIAAWILVLSAHADLVFGTVAAAATLGAAIAYVPWNIGLPRKIFLGDVGSYGLGFGLAAFGLYLWSHGVSLVLVVAPFLLYALDTSLTVLQRAVRGEPVMTAHRQHRYQQLVDLGVPHAAVAVWVAGTEIATCACAWLLQDAPVLVVASWAVLAVAYLSSPRLVRRLRDRELTRV